ncbi:hypothetical protein DVT68_18780 [Dyella solisilvae]|uniref:Transmembrane signal peptide protein n=1 Tax=Dyella solisilvae TaxID=1920168 RepID=A0A370K3B2_9GAMM|nr:RcnB family protein [Dyella solisilvae]RDI97122.1 hypothetical protein DVT68_18780 [Dyella solisilvae]
MKRLLIIALSAALLSGSLNVMASPQDEHGHDAQWDKDHHDDQQGHNPKDEGRHDNGNHKGWEKQAYRRGERMPDRYYSREYYVTDYARYHVAPPQPGYRWIRDDSGQLVLTAIATGLIVDIAIQH